MALKCKKPKMDLRRLASLIALREGKKSQARVGDIREIISILIDHCAEEIALELVDAEDIELITWGDSETLMCLDQHICKLAAKKLRAK